jgi:two-component system, chemotaxis family, CheB/CheR fusion protein
LVDTEPEHGEHSESGGDRTFPIVGIGASAGGLESLEQFFGAMPSDTGMAFIVVQHLSPDFKTLMAELLARHSDMMFTLAVDGEVVEPNHVYLLPPGKDLRIKRGRLLLSDKEPRVLPQPIDVFFRSLAADAGPRAIAIVLSGSGSDGSHGIVAVKSAGGSVLAESADTAHFDGMPTSATATGVVDFVGAPHELAARVCGAPIAPRPQLDDAEPRALEPNDPLAQVLGLLDEQFGIDFSRYKLTTVGRRLERRVSLKGLPDMAAYAEELRSNPLEQTALYQDLLIGVTRFFRDPEAFAFVEQNVIPEILSKVPASEQIRIWVAGCATGEEAYSLALLFHEQLTKLGRPINLKVLATDMHRVSLDAAAVGIYGRDQLAHVAPERRARYFVETSSGYQVSPELRQLVVFAPHNVMKDAPFTRMHLVSCRNMLIYFRPDVQRSVISLFHFGLATGGILLLGPSESVGVLGHEFATLNERWKVFRKRRDIRLVEPLQLSAGRGADRGRGPDAARTQRVEPQLLQSYDRLLDRFMPPSFLVDESARLLDTFAGAERYLRVKSRRPTGNLLDMVDGDLRTVVAGALSRVVREGNVVACPDVPLMDDTGVRNHVVRLELVQRPRSDQSHVLVSLELMARGDDADGTTHPPAGQVSVAQASRERMQSLEGELSYAREVLQSTVEELETSNEELQATNEELVASNEELQSTNEELHSVNEELYTVNAEYQTKIEELQQLNADIAHLLEGTEVGTIFLDRDLRIRRYTERIGRVFRIQDRDIGREIRDFSHTLQRPTLIEEIERALEQGISTEAEARDETGTPHFLRVLPYRTGGKTRGNGAANGAPRPISGVVLTLTDISVLKAAQGELAKNQEQIQQLLESTAEAIYGVDTRGLCTFCNPACARLLGFRAPVELIGRDMHEIVHRPGGNGGEPWSHNCRLTSAFRGGGPAHSSSELFFRADGSSFAAEFWSHPVVRDGRLAGAVFTFLDVSERQRAEEEVRAGARRRERFLAMLSHELRNPLAAVLNAVRLISAGGGPPDIQLKARNVIDRQGRHMARLLDDLLDVSRITSGKFELRKEQVSLDESVRAAIEALEPLVREQGVSLVTSLPDEPIMVDGDGARLQQVVANLLSNAARYSSPGSRVELALRREDDSAWVSVRDFGAGIEPSFLPRIFELFVQSEQPARPSSHGGLGIGLALVRRIVELHDGHVEARSEGRGQGSEFVVKIPCSAKRTNLASQPPEGSGGACRIVLVEDQVDAREMMRALLELRGHQVIEAADAYGAIETIRRERPDAAVVDIGLPELSGYDVARAVRESEGCDQMLLIALTGYGSQSDLRAAEEAGFDAHLTKPAEPERLFRLLANRTTPGYRRVPGAWSEVESTN